MRGLAIMAFLAWSVVLGGLTVFGAINAAKAYEERRSEDEAPWEAKRASSRTSAGLPPISLVAFIWASKEILLTVGQLWFWGAFFCLCIFLFASPKDAGRRSSPAT